MAHPKLMLFLSFLLFLVVFSLSSCDGALDEPLPTATPSSVMKTHFLYQDGVPRKSRKLLEGGDDLVQIDYDYAGANPRHDPRRGRGGGRP